MPRVARRRAARECVHRSSGWSARLRPHRPCACSARWGGPSSGGLKRRSAARRRPKPRTAGRWRRGEHPAADDEVLGPVQLKEEVRLAEAPRSVTATYNLTMAASQRLSRPVAMPAWRWKMGRRADSGPLPPPPRWLTLPIGLSLMAQPWRSILSLVQRRGGMPLTHPSCVVR